MDIAKLIRGDGILELATAIRRRVGFRRLLISIAQAIHPHDALDAAKSLFDTAEPTIIEEASPDLEKLYRDSASPTLRYWLIETIAKTRTLSSNGIFRRLQQIEGHPLPANALVDALSAQT